MVSVAIPAAGVFCCTVQLVVYAVPFLVTGGAELEAKLVKFIVRRSSNLSWASAIASEDWAFKETSFVWLTINEVTASALMEKITIATSTSIKLNPLRDDFMLGLLYLARGPDFNRFRAATCQRQGNIHNRRNFSWNSRMEQAALVKFDLLVENGSAD